MIAIQPRFLALLALCAAAVAAPSEQNVSGASNVSEPVHVPRAPGLPAGLPTGLPGLPAGFPPAGIPPTARNVLTPPNAKLPAPVPTPHGMVRKRSSPPISAKLPTSSDKLPTDIEKAAISKAPVHPRSEYVPQPVGHPPISRSYARQLDVVGGALATSGRKDTTIMNPMAGDDDDRNLVHTYEDNGRDDMTFAPTGEPLAHTHTESRRGGETEGSEDMDSNDYDEREQTEERRAEVEKQTPSIIPVGATVDGKAQ
ncbi:hypothetical protein DFH08DRAFT_797514 [Mycena albidolilacea]|uniref:Uncharacterized protein n=1 Tax=Mycena albidolilacea TaxID=1033008 RepID=A0AAD7ARA4_9AGAR|nr:hypothetical protein DFH08DRAFT_797514 [Mycena albidolilacea]